MSLIFGIVGHWSNEQLKGCTSRLAAMGIGCAGKGLIGIAACATGIASFASNVSKCICQGEDRSANVLQNADCAGCFDRPEACSVSLPILNECSKS